jgi:hypothetical protein
MRVLLFLAMTSSALAQSVVNPARLPDRWKSFEKPEKDARIRCRVNSIRPQLNFGFRFQTGYSVEVPMKQYSGAAHKWAVVVRVTPQAKEREPVWLLSQLRVPEVPDTKATAAVSGSYLVGEGEYRVDLLLVDEQNRACTDGWRIRAKMNNTVRDVRPGLAPGVVDDISLRRWRRMLPTEGVDEGRYNVAILLHASAMFPGRVRLRGYDRALLLSALTSMVERLPVRNVRLTVFSLDKQEEIYHTPDLTAGTFRQAMAALNRVELGIVDYDTLQKRKGHVDLMSDLLDRELSAKDPPHALIFLGPVGHYGDRVEDEALRERLGSRPIYYVQLRPFSMVGGLQPDTINRTVRHLGGKTKLVYSPEDFAEAIQELERLLRFADAGRSTTPEFFSPDLRSAVSRP